jgi:CRISPR-associated protein Cas5h
MNKCLVFTIKSRYGRFRKPYTTTSALTYTIIHPLAVKGILGAVIGIDKNELYHYTQDFKIAIQVLSKVKKDMQSFNLLNMKKSYKFFRFPSNIEFLREPNYRIFVVATEEKLNTLEETFESGDFVFTPYLGASEHIAKITYEGVYKTEKLKRDIYYVDTAIPEDNIELKLREKDEYVINIDNIPIKNNVKREYSQYKKVIFPSEGKKLRGLCEGLYKVGDKNVFFL